VEKLTLKCQVKPSACSVALWRVGIYPRSKRVGIKDYKWRTRYEPIMLWWSLHDPWDWGDRLSNDICDRLGLDTFCRNLCAFAMEASEMGRIKKKKSVGETSIKCHLLHDISSKRNRGIFGEGIRSTEFGRWRRGDPCKKPWHRHDMIRESLKEWDCHATSDRGACHLRAPFYKAELAGDSHGSDRRKAKLSLNSKIGLIFMIRSSMSFLPGHLLGLELFSTSSKWNRTQTRWAG